MADPDMNVAHIGIIEGHWTLGALIVLGAGVAQLMDSKVVRHAEGLAA